MQNVHTVLAQDRRELNRVQAIGAVGGMMHHVCVGAGIKSRQFIDVCAAHHVHMPKYALRQTRNHLRHLILEPTASESPHGMAHGQRLRRHRWICRYLPLLRQERLGTGRRRIIG
jgi:hypothetical protein